MDAHVLIDYDNLTALFQRMSLRTLALRIQATADQQCSTLNDIFIRLYGGWYGPAGLTNKGTRLAQEIRLTFPLLMPVAGSQIRRIHCEIASSLVASRGFVLPNTFRERPGIRGKLRLIPHKSCVNSALCTAAHVVHWSNGRCPEQGCQVTAKEVFAYYEQKLVDTLLCCDLIALANQSPTVATFVISDDDDMVPAFLMAGLASGHVWQLQMRRMNSRPYAMAMQQHNVQVAAL